MRHFNLLLFFLLGFLLPIVLALPSYAAYPGECVVFVKTAACDSEPWETSVSLSGYSCNFRFSSTGTVLSDWCTGGGVTLHRNGSCVYGPRYREDGVWKQTTNYAVSSYFDETIKSITRSGILVVNLDPNGCPPPPNCDFEDSALTAQCGSEANVEQWNTNPTACDNGRCKDCPTDQDAGTVVSEGMFSSPPNYCVMGCWIVPDGSFVLSQKDADTGQWYTTTSYKFPGSMCDTTPGTGDPPPPENEPCESFLSKCQIMCKGGDTTGTNCSTQGRTCACDLPPPPYPLVDPGDGSGPQPDQDKDGVPSGQDSDVDGDGNDNGTDPNVDGDNSGNGSDNDTDGDGVGNGGDDSTWNPDRGSDNGRGADGDVDGDGIPNGEDADIDGDGVGNSGDSDMDGDGVGNCTDADVDGDGLPNGSDPDIDGDGILNSNDTDPFGCGIESEGGEDGEDPCVDNLATPENECAPCVDNPATPEDECAGPAGPCIDNPATPLDECGAGIPSGTCPEGEICTGDGVCQPGEAATSADCAAADYIKTRIGSMMDNIKGTGVLALADGLTLPAGGNPVMTVDLGNLGGGQKSFDFSSLDSVWAILKVLFSICFAFVSIKIILLKS